MRFFTRSLVGLVILGITLGLLMLAGGRIFSALEELEARDDRPTIQRERVFAVDIGTLETVTVSPVITAFGEVASWRMLELRAPASGRLVEMAPEFRDGGLVFEGELLFETDPSSAQTALDLAQTDLQEANSELAEAKVSVALAQDELQAAKRQKELREQALARQENLRSRGVGTEAAVEAAALAASSAEQSLLSQRQALAQAEARVNRAEISLRRREISLAEARRDLADTRFNVPFEGILSEVTAVRGRLVSKNEKLGVLIDPAALEVSFRVSNAQFARLLDGGGGLRRVPIRATLDLDGLPITVTGLVDRAGAEVGQGLTGRLVFARLENVATGVLRPGDFLTVEIIEPELSGVAVIPAGAATAEGRILLVGEDDRLEEVTVTVLRRQADSLVVADAPFGRKFVTQRTPQLGVGVRVRPVGRGGAIEEPEMVQLTEEKRARLMATVKASKRMPDEVKKRLLGQLEKPEIRADTLSRLESRMGGGRNPGAAGEAPATISLEEDRRARLIAFVKANGSIPDDAKKRILAQLAEPRVPKAMVERLESRMGG
ncbi:MAG: efflux RND transporter periplasmic adaptor subunit [Paracoccaceae bacterium]